MGKASIVTTAVVTLVASLFIWNMQHSQSTLRQRVERINGDVEILLARNNTCETDDTKPSRMKIRTVSNISRRRSGKGIKPGEVIELEFSGWSAVETEVAGRHLVLPDGKISLGDLGKVGVAGLSHDEAEAQVRDFIAEKMVESLTVRLKSGGKKSTASAPSPSTTSIGVSTPQNGVAIPSGYAPLEYTAPEMPQFPATQPLTPPNSPMMKSGNLVSENNEYLHR